MSRLRLTLACWDYDRTRALMDGRVQPEGIDLNYLALPVEETFFRMQRFREFDVAEMSLSEYVLSLFFDDPPFIALPVFPSRLFRHSSIYVHTGSGITEPADLIGKRVGVPEFHITAAVWIRGILQDKSGVPVTAVSYFTGGQEQPGRIPRIALTLPEDLRVQRIDPGQTLSSMLETGELDALYSARAPSPFRRGSQQVRRLFADYAAVERQYFHSTRIFPIMHTVVVRRDVYARHPWVAQALTKAFTEAKACAYGDLHESTALKITLPWLIPAVEDVDALMGQDFWPYGVAANRNTLETFLRYSAEQGLARQILAPDDLFAPETLESYKV